MTSSLRRSGISIFTHYLLLFTYYLLLFTFYFLFNHLRPHVGLQGFRYAYAFGRLEVLEQRSDDAGQRQGRAVERVAQLYLLVGAAVAALQAVGLIRVEVRNGAHLEPALLRLAIHLEVVAHGSREAHVAAAEAQDAVGELQLLQQSLHVLEHLPVALGTVLGRVDAHDFYLRELVQAVQAAHVLAVGASLAAEALRVGAVLDGQVGLAEDDVAVDVRPWG